MNMSCLTTSRRAEILARISKLEAQLVIANDTLDSGLSTDIREYRFDSGEGSQRVEYKTFDEMTKIVDWLESRIDYLRRKLNGTGLLSMNLRRKQYYFGNGRGW